MDIRELFNSRKPATSDLVGNYIAGRKKMSQRMESIISRDRSLNEKVYSIADIIRAIDKMANTGDPLAPLKGPNPDKKGWLNFLATSYNFTFDIILSVAEDLKKHR